MQYDKNRFKIQALPHPFVLHWVLNPVIMFNELILGQRLPKVMLIDKESDKPWMERCYIPCLHCETLNDVRLWEKSHVVCGHWFSIVCPSCHQIIPCLWNIFSLAVLATTLPLWYFPARYFRQRWLEKEKERLANVLERPLIQTKSINLLLSLLMGVFGSVPTWVIAEVLEVLYYGEEWDLKTMLESLPFYLLGGFVSGSFMHVASLEKEKKRVTNVLERHLLQAKSINWFFRGTFYCGGFLWVAFEVLPEMWEILNGREWDLRAMFDMLPFCLLGGFIWGSFMHVVMNLKGRKT